MKYDDAVQIIIKAAILQSQYDAARSVNEKQLTLYYGIGKYIYLNSRTGFWGKGAIDAISERLQKELQGLRGFTSRNLRYIRTFYEEWAMIDTSAAVDARHALAVATAKTCEDDLNLVPAGAKLPDGSKLAIATANLELASSNLSEISKPMGVATYKTADDMPEKLRKALPDVEALRRLLDGERNDPKP